jgi:hypothetical protein
VRPQENPTDKARLKQQEQQNQSSAHVSGDPKSEIVEPAASISLRWLEQGSGEESGCRALGTAP